jgi:hypothetical protein
MRYRELIGPLFLLFVKVAETLRLQSELDMPMLER